MAMKEVAVQGAILEYQLPVTGSPASFVTPPSTKVKIQGKGVYEDNAQIMIPSGITDGNCTSTVPAFGNIPTTAVKVKADGQLVLRVDDQVTVSGIVGVLSAGGASTMTATVKISDAGQAKVKAQ